MDVTNETWETEVEKSDLPVIVDFWASWCGPCQMMKPVFEETATDYEGKLKFVKCNVEEQQELAQKCGIMGIPALIVFKDAKEVGRITGFNPKDAFKAKIDEILNKI